MLSTLWFSYIISFLEFPFFKDSFIFILSLYMNSLSAYMSVHHVCAWCLKRPEGGFRYPRTIVTDSCEHHVGGRNWTQVLGRSSSAPDCWATSPPSGVSMFSECCSSAGVFLFNSLYPQPSRILRSLWLCHLDTRGSCLISWVWVLFSHFFMAH